MNNVNKENVKENKMGTMPVGKLLFTMSLPTTFSMLIMALYNIVDSIFVSRYSENALTAVSLAFPLQSLMVAFMVGTSVGICSVISRRLGEKREDEAKKAASTGFVIIIVFSLMFLLIGIFFSKTFIGLFTDDSELLQLGTTYLSIVLGVSIGAFIQTFTEKTLQGTGDTLHPMIIQATGAIINIILDPIFIFGYCGLPSMGIAGAAIATVLGQIIGMFIGLFYLAKNKSISFSFLKPKFDKAVAKDILQVGIPSVVMQGIGSIMTSLMNGILIAYDIIATTVFGVYFKLQSFVFMPVFGMNSGLMPILGYNYGAKNKERMMKALKIGLGAAFTYMSLGTLVFNLFPDELLGIFNASENLLRIGRVAIRIISFSFPIASICIMLGSVFQAIGDGYVSMIVSLARQLGVLIPCAWLFGRLMGLDAIWYSYLVAEIASITISLIFFIKEQKTKLDF